MLAVIEMIIELHYITYIDFTACLSVMFFSMTFTVHLYLLCNTSAFVTSLLKATGCDLTVLRISKLL